MIEPINISKPEDFIELSKGVYNVFIIGGWSLDIGKFNFSLERLNDNTIVQPEMAEIKFQSHYRFKRTKKIFSVVINKGGKYKIEFNNQESLILKKSFFFSMFQKKLAKENIELLFERS